MQGEYIGIINSDDVYTKDALKIIYKYIKIILKKILFLAALKNTGVFYMDLNQKKPIQLGFLRSHSTGFFIKETQQKKMDLIIQSIGFTLIMIIFTE